jgi:thioesterase domain-containing protein
LITTLSIILTWAFLPPQILAQNFHQARNSSANGLLPSSSERFFQEGREIMERELKRLQQVESQPEENLLTIQEQQLEQQLEEFLEENEIHFLDPPNSP